MVSSMSMPINPPYDGLYMSALGVDLPKFQRHYDFDLTQAIASLNLVFLYVRVVPCEAHKHVNRLLAIVFEHLEEDGGVLMQVAGDHNELPEWADAA